MPIKIILAILLSLLTIGQAQATIVGFSQSNIPVKMGDIFDVSVIGSEFDFGLDGGGVNIKFDKSVVNLVDVTLDSVWDIFSSAGSIDNTKGIVSSIQFGTFSSLPSDFTIAKLRFTTVGIGDSILQVSESFDLGGFSLLGSHMDVKFSSATVSSVPLPSSIYFMLSACALIIPSLRRKTT